MVVARRIVDFVDGINDIHNVLYGYGLVRTKHYCSLGVVADSGVDEVGELALIRRDVVYLVSEILVNIYSDCLLGHGLATA